MGQQLAGVAQCIGSDENRTEFHDQWQALLGKLQRRFWWLEEARIADAVADALLRRLSQEDVDVEEAPDGAADLAVRSLYAGACHLVCNGVRADQRRRCREREYARQKKNWYFEDFFVQNGLSAEHISIEDHSEEDLERFVSKCNSWEQEFVTLRKQSVEDPSAYAEVLGIPPCPPEEQRRAVAQAWNRIRMKLQRKRRRAHATDRP